MQRLRSLDALRGLAALVVVAHHCSLVLPGVRERIDATVVLRPLVGGGEAVGVFFVLSGYVLAGWLDSASAPGFGVYAARRVARLWPPLIVAALGSAALWCLVGSRAIPGVTAWFAQASWSFPPTPATLAGHVLLLHSARFESLNNAVWSLAHELRFSLLLPLLMVPVRRHPAVTLLAIAVAAEQARLHVPRELWSLVLNPVVSLRYLLFFAAGCAIAVHGEAVARLLESGPARSTAVRIVTALVLLYGTGDAAGPLAAAGAALLVATAATDPAVTRWLDRPLLVRLGELSYSLYLVHLPVLLALFHALHGIVPDAAILLAVPAVALPVASVVHRRVERPSIAWARRIGSRRRTSSRAPGRPALPAQARP